MILVLLASATAMLIFKASLVSFLAEFLRPFHSFCLLQVPTDATSAIWLSSAVCGTYPQATPASFDLRTFGFFRLVLVSGTQLLLLEQALRWIFKKHLKQDAPPAWFDGGLTATAIVYAAFAGFPAALVRVIWQFGLKTFSIRAKLFWQPAQIALLAGALTIVVAPELADSLSLEIGWIASLVLTGLPRKQPTLLRQLILYVSLVIPLLPLGVPHPLSILVNAFLTPFLVVILFPVSMAAVLIHAASPIADFAWGLVVSCAQTVGDVIEPLDWHLRLSPVVGWIYLATLQIFFLFRAKADA